MIAFARSHLLAAAARVERLPQAQEKALKPCVLELGGSDPYLIMHDADLNLAVEKAIQSRILNTGQSCIGAKRIILDQRIANAFSERLLSVLESIQPSNPTDETCQLGPIARSDLRDGLRTQVEKNASRRRASAHAE